MHVQDNEGRREDQVRPLGGGQLHPRRQALRAERDRVPSRRCRGCRRPADAGEMDNTQHCGRVRTRRELRSQDYGRKGRLGAACPHEDNERRREHACRRQRLPFADRPPRDRRHDDARAVDNRVRQCQSGVVSEARAAPGGSYERLLGRQEPFCACQGASRLVGEDRHVRRGERPRGFRPLRRRHRIQTDGRDTLGGLLCGYLPAALCALRRMHARTGDARRRRRGREDLCRCGHTQEVGRGACRDSGPPARLMPRVGRTARKAAWGL